MMNHERQCLDKMMAAAGASLLSVEHDGIVIRDATPELIETIKASVPWPVQETVHPRTRQEFLRFAAEPHPEHDWTVTSRIE